MKLMMPEDTALALYRSIDAKCMMRKNTDRQVVFRVHIYSSAYVIRYEIISYI